MKQKIYDYLKAAGLPRAAIIGIMGNLMEESNCEPCRLQGDFTMGRTKSKEYARKVDTNEISRHLFMFDCCGWGLYQLTYSTRKAGFYDLVKAENGSIADYELQLKYMIKELKEDFPQLWAFLKVTTSVYNATARFCKEFERPAINNIEARYAMAQKIEKELRQAQEQVSEYWPPRMIDKNMSGPDVEVLQAILKARGYAINYVSGKFDDLLESQVKAFQSNCGLDSDGVCGPLTWAQALERG